MIVILSIVRIMLFVVIGNMLISRNDMIVFIEYFIID